MIHPLQLPSQSFSLPILHSPLGLAHVLALAAAVFALGLFAALAHRSLLRILMGLTLMLLAALIALAAFTTYLQPTGLHGHAVSLLLVLATLAQLLVGLALASMLLRKNRKTPMDERDALDVDRYDDLKG